MPFTNDTKPSTSYAGDSKPSGTATNNFVFSDGNNFTFSDANNFVFATGGSIYSNDSKPS